MNFSSQISICLMMTAALWLSGCKPSQEPSSGPAAASTTAPSNTNQTAALPPGHPEIDMSKMKLPPGAMAEAKNPTWTVPEDWVAGAPSAVRRGSFMVKGTGDLEGQAAEIAVTVFPGDVGGMLMNINRWRQQIGLEPITEDKVSSVVSPIDVNGKTVMVVDLKGEGPIAGKSHPQRMLVGLINHEANTWFIKMTGDAPLVGKQQPKFDAFVQSVKFPTP